MVAPAYPVGHLQTLLVCRYLVSEHGMAAHYTEFTVGKLAAGQEYLISDSDLAYAIKRRKGLDIIGEFCIYVNGAGKQTRVGSYPEHVAAGQDAYIASLEATGITSLTLDEQYAYWINLYNAGTVQLILDRYPVKSIRDIKLGGLFSSRGGFPPQLFAGLVLLGVVSLIPVAILKFGKSGERA